MSKQLTETAEKITKQHIGDTFKLINPPNEDKGKMYELISIVGNACFLMWVNCHKLCLERSLVCEKKDIYLTSSRPSNYYTLLSSPPTQAVVPTDEKLKDILSEFDLAIRMVDSTDECHYKYAIKDIKALFVSPVVKPIDLIPLSEISDYDAIEVGKLLFRHPNPEYDIEPIEVSIVIEEKKSDHIKLDVVCRCFEGFAYIGFNGDMYLLDEDDKRQDCFPIASYQYLQSKGYILPKYY